MTHSWDKSSKKSIKIDININGSGNMNPSDMNEIKKSITSALVSADLEHMIEVW
jgi:hypothetical protein